MRSSLCRSLVGAVLASVALVAVFSISASATAPLKLTNCNRAVARPTLLTLTCGDGNTVLKGLRWSSFGGPSARATATFVTNTCTPNCAAGKDVSYPARVQVTSPRTCKGGVRVYNKLKLEFLARAPGPGVPRSWTLGCPI
jgi:hypothetical protein